MPVSVPDITSIAPPLLIIRHQTTTATVTTPPPRSPRPLPTTSSLSTGTGKYVYDNIARLVFCLGKESMEGCKRTKLGS